jgi:PAS domain S-box-containing protein
VEGCAGCAATRTWLRLLATCGVVSAVTVFCKPQKQWGSGDGNLGRNGIAMQIAQAVLSALQVNVAVLDKTGRIVEVNDSWMHFAQENGGSPASTGVGSNYLDVCSQSFARCPDAEYVAEGIRSVIAGRAARFVHEYRCDSWNEQRWFIVRVIPASFLDGGVIVTHQNDTELKRSEARYGELLDSVRAIVWRADPTFRTSYVSKQSEDVLGYPARAWIEDPDLWKKTIHPEDRDWVFEHSSNAVREGRKHSFEYRMCTPDGRTVWLRNLVNVIAENGHPVELVGVSVDITERKLAEEALSEIPQRLLQAQEEERASIARELHDDIGQKLAMLSMTLSRLEQECVRDPAKLALARESHALTLTIAEDARRLSHGLHPSSLELLGLASAVRQQCIEFGATTSATVHHSIGNLPANLGKDVMTCIFRVLQEALHNITKHSKARQIEVKLWAESGEIRLQVKDDGVGFEKAKIPASQGLGLVSMNERVRLVRGSLQLKSTPGQGTEIDVRVPF